MKTTLDISDELYHQAKILAAFASASLIELVTFDRGFGKFPHLRFSQL